MAHTRLRDYFLQLASIDAVSLHERPVADFLQQHLSAWSLDSHEDDAANRIHGNCGNLVVKVPARELVDDPPLMLLAHMDTVSSTAGLKVIQEEGVFRSDGRTILGADNRAGVSLILYLLDLLHENHVPHRALEVVFSVAEELGMYGTSSLDYTRFSAREAYIFDCSAKPGGYVSETPTACDFAVTFHGKAAHSAVCPEKGLNAISMAAGMISNFPVGRISAQSVANIGTIQGGTAVNVVPGQVQVTGEYRSFSGAELAELQQKLLSVSQEAAAQYGGRYEHTLTLGFQGFKLSPDSPVIRRLHDAMAELELTPHPMVYAGGSDANVLHQHGIQAVNLGIGASNAHSPEERIAFADMAMGAELLLRLVGSH
jgi:tripeptide aminopeptidase